jgi:hypothetical protein
MQGRIKRDIESVRIPIIGRIKCGVKDDRGIPKSLDYFIAEGNYKAMFDREFGEKPTNIKIVFLSDDITETCNERLEIRKGAKLFAFGDGKDFKVWAKDIEDYKDFSITEHPKIMEMCEQKAENKWQTVLTLRFLIPKISGVFGVWQLTTKGVESSIPQIVSVYDKVKSIAGTVMNIPFDLSIEKVKSQKPESKNLFPVIRLIPNVSQESLEVVRNFIESNKPVQGLLTDERIQELKSIPEEIPEDVANTIDADYKLELENQEE